MRSVRYGNQPMPPSDSITFNLGCRCSRPENTMSDNDHMRFVENTLIATAKGACGSTTSLSMNEKPGTKLPEPKCRHTGISVSSKACQTGSQCVGWWNDGSPSGMGASGNDTALDPISLARRTSS